MTNVIYKILIPIGATTNLFQTLNIKGGVPEDGLEFFIDVRNIFDDKKSFRIRKIFKANGGGESVFLFKSILH